MSEGRDGYGTDPETQTAHKLTDSMVRQDNDGVFRSPCRRPFGVVDARVTDQPEN